MTKSKTTQEIKSSLTFQGRLISALSVLTYSSMIGMLMYEFVIPYDSSISYLLTLYLFTQPILILINIHSIYVWQKKTFLPNQNQSLKHTGELIHSNALSYKIKMTIQHIFNLLLIILIPWASGISPYELEDSHIKLVGAFVFILTSLQFSYIKKMNELVKVITNS